MGTIRDGEPSTVTSTFTQLLSSDFVSVKPILFNLNEPDLEVGFTVLVPDCHSEKV